MLLSFHTGTTCADDAMAVDTNEDVAPPLPPGPDVADVMSAVPSVVAPTAETIVLAGATAFVFGPLVGVVVACRG